MKPINISVDLQANAVYVRYRNPVGIIEQLDVARDANGAVRWFTVGEDEDHDPHVVVDVDGTGEVVGVEILGFDAETMRLAHDLCTARGLSAPADLGGAIAALRAA